MSNIEVNTCNLLTCYSWPAVTCYSCISCTKVLFWQKSVFPLSTLFNVSSTNPLQHDFMALTLRCSAFIRRRGRNVRFRMASQRCVRVSIFASGMSFSFPPLSQSSIIFRPWMHLSPLNDVWGHPSSGASQSHYFLGTIFCTLFLIAQAPSTEQ